MKTCKLIALYLVSCTWGIIMTIVGFIAAFFCLVLGKKIKIHNGMICIHWEGNWGDVTLGTVIIMDDNGWESEWTFKHEFGHVIQNVILGPLMPFVIDFPSIIHAALHSKLACCKGKSYYHFYTEAWANILGGTK